MPRLARLVQFGLPLMAASGFGCVVWVGCGDSGSTPGNIASGAAAGAGAGAVAVAGTGAAGAAGGPSVGMAGRGAAGAGLAGRGGAGSPAAAGSGTTDEDAGAPPDVAQPDAGLSPVDAGEPPDATVAEPRMDLGKGDGSDVITIGDSWMSNTLGTGDAVEGALSRLTMQPYRNYGVQGVLLLEDSFAGEAITSQYTNAKRRDPDISTVIMTGGGNDIIQNRSVRASCDSGGDECTRKLAEIQAGLNTLWTEMASDGVKDVVYIRYSNDAGSSDPSVRMDSGSLPAVCASGKIRCHAIETTDAVMDEFLPDGIHPARAANERIAKLVWDSMVKEGVRR